MAAMWQVYENGVWVDLPTPSEYSVNSEDLDVDSYRSVVNGNLVRNKLGTWTTISFTFYFQFEADAINFLKHIINVYPLKIKAPSPLITGGKAELIGYVGKSTSEYTYTQAGMGYKISFNFIEGKK